MSSGGDEKGREEVIPRCLAGLDGAFNVRYGKTTKTIELAKGKAKKLTRKTFQ